MPQSPDPLGEALAEAWQTNQRINEMLIDEISLEGMAATLSKRGGRSVARQLAHLHSVRVWHLEKRAKDLADGLAAFETADEPDGKTLKRRLRRSAARIETLLRDVAAGKPKRRGFKHKGPAALLAYFVAHESHHRGNILLTLKQCGHAVPQNARYAIWDWDRI